jgi:putative transposase
MESGATTDLERDELTRLAVAERSWTIATDHRGLKQCCGVERAQGVDSRKVVIAFGSR